MDVKKCDRCGKIYERAVPAGSIFSATAEMIKNILEPETVGDEFADDVNENVCDLCYGCRESLAEWYREGKEGQKDGRTPDVCENDN